MTFDAIHAWWWPYLFIVIAGALATDVWRFLGVYLGGRLSEESDLLVLVRAVATALALRIGAAAVGFVAYLALGRRMVVGILVAEAVLGLGLAFGL